MENALKPNEWRRIWVLKTFKTEIQKGELIIQPFFRIGSPQEISSHLFHFWKFEKFEKSTPESCRLYAIFFLIGISQVLVF